jgi:hypothetical protein
LSESTGTNILQVSFSVCFIKIQEADLSNRNRSTTHSAASPFHAEFRCSTAPEPRPTPPPPKAAAG